MLPEILRWILLTIACAPFAYYLLAIYCAWDYFRELRTAGPAQSTFTPPVSLLKPVRGLDRDAYENFASFCSQDYPEFEVLFAVAEEHDPVLPLIHRLREAFPRIPIRLITGIEQLGANRKLNNLVRLAREARHDILVISDSDVRATPANLPKSPPRSPNPPWAWLPPFSGPRPKASSPPDPEPR